jgi:hypothetical protein
LNLFVLSLCDVTKGCCWAFGGASAASDRACIASNGTIFAPFSAEDICFNANVNGCNGGTVSAPWSYIKRTGVVTGNQNLEGACSSVCICFFKKSSVIYYFVLF